MIKDYKKIVIVSIGIILLVSVMFSTYATLSDLGENGLTTNILRIDEEAYGNLSFNSDNLNFGPILDNEVSNTNNSVIYLDFKVGGSKENDTDDIIYDIALVDLEVDCELVSPYLKWKLFKNGELVSDGSLDYKFDTIKNGRLVLTPIQQDLKKYSEDKTTYDYFEFYMWVSDSFQDNNLANYNNQVDQSYLMDKLIKGKIEVELYGGKKKELVRTPSEELDTNNCIVNNEN